MNFMEILSTTDDGCVCIQMQSYGYGCRIFDTVCLSLDITLCPLSVKYSTVRVLYHLKTVQYHYLAQFFKGL